MTPIFLWKSVALLATFPNRKLPCLWNPERCNAPIVERRCLSVMRSSTSYLTTSEGCAIYVFSGSCGRLR